MLLLVGETRTAVGSLEKWMLSGVISRSYQVGDSLIRVTALRIVIGQSLCLFLEKPEVGIFDYFGHKPMQSSAVTFEKCRIDSLLDQRVPK